MTIEQVRNLPLNVVQQIVSTRGEYTGGLSEEQVQFILQLNHASVIINDPECQGSQLNMARELQKRMPSISLRTARRRIADAVTFLYSDQTNTPEQWHEFYADKMDHLAVIAEKDGDVKTALMCYKQAHELREKAAGARVDPALTEFKQILVSPDLGMERMGLEAQGMRDLLNNAYALIERSNLPEKEKQRLRKEAQLEIGIEEIEGK